MNRNKSWTLTAYYQKNKEKIMAYQREYHRTHPRKHKTSRADNLRRNYGMTLDQYNEILVLQNGKCAGCGKHESEFKKALAVDHDHKTGKIRGLLCTQCNRVLGCCYDDAGILLNLIDYLKGVKPCN